MVLARALLKCAKVIIMDEATSSVDYECVVHGGSGIGAL